MKHFNMGNVWGKVAGFTEEISDNDKPYLAIQIECPNELYGNIKTYGRLWGRDKVDAFLDYHKKNPGTVYKFQGFFSQYDKEEGRRYSNFTFYSWSPVSGKEFRAAFVLTGEVTAAEKINGEGKIYLHLIREGQGTYKDIEEDFEIYTLNAQEVDGIKQGDLIETAGMLRTREPEDFFGRPSSAIKPYIKEMTIKKQTEVAEEAF